MVRKMLCVLLLGLVGGVSTFSQADEFCLLLAENYHEQLYCELQALGQGQDLPPLRDFRRNDSLTQALLLKRPAARVGIKVLIPKQTVAARPSIPDNTTASLPSERDGFEAACQLKGIILHCGDSRYRLVGNQANSHLSAGALDRANKMAIPFSPDSVSDRRVLVAYLARAYRQYLTKMLEIGLGGSTFSFRKFIYLFDDVTARGLDFSERFETMFGFLKQDKQRMSVNERLPDIANLEASHCEQLDQVVAVCDGGRKNYLFKRDN
ncbi:hypothetical protein [Porticoccus sp.]